MLMDLFMSKETVSSAGTADGIQGERRISFHSSDRRSSRRYRKPSGTRSRLGSGGANTELTKVTRGSDYAVRFILLLYVFTSVHCIWSFSCSLNLCYVLVYLEPDSFISVGDMIVSTRRKSVSYTQIF